MGFCNSGLRGGKHFVAQRDLFGVNGPFSNHPESRRAQRLSAKPLIVGKVTKRAIYWQDAVASTGGNNGRLRPVPWVGPVFYAVVSNMIVLLCTTDAGGRHAH